MLFCAVFLYRYFCAVLRCSYPLTSLTPPLFGLLSDLKFYYMYVKVSCEDTDTETDLSVLIHATLISSTEKCHLNVETLQVSGSFSNCVQQPRVVLKVTINKLTEEDQYRIMILTFHSFSCCITQFKWQNTKTIYSVSGTSDMSLTT